MVRFQTSPFVEEVPLLKPPSRGVHGAASVDCVTVWPLEKSRVHNINKNGKED